MAVTTYPTVLTAQLADIKAITPTSYSSFPFRVHDTPQEFEDWLESNPGACFRRFELRRIFDDEFAEVSNTDVEEEIAQQELVVAYPRMMTGTYTTPRDRDVLIDEDKHSLLKAVGINGYANYSNAAIVSDEPQTLDPLGDSILLLRIPITFAFWRSVT